MADQEAGEQRQALTQSQYVRQFSGEHFGSLMGFRFELLVPGIAVISIHVEKKHLNPMGTLHGGVLMAMADSAAGCACSYVDSVCPTVEGKLNFMMPAFAGDTISATGKEIRHGATLLSGEVTITNQQGQIIAVGLYTYIRSHKKLPPVQAAG